MLTNSLATYTHITEEQQKCKLIITSRIFMWITQAQGQTHISY